MSIFLDAMTSQYLATTAHASMLFSLLWVREDYVLSSLPLGRPNQEEYDDLDVSFSIFLGLSLLLIIIEVLLNFRQIPRNSISVFSLFFHTIACIVLLKFIVDVHPVWHFWYIFGLFSVLPFLLHLFVFCLSFDVKSFC